MRKDFFSDAFFPSFLRCLFLSSASMLLFCLGLVMPHLGILGVMFASAPLALIGVRENKIWMTLGLLCAALSLWLAFDAEFAVSFLLGYGLMSFGLTLPLGRLEKGTECLLFCVFTSILSKVAFWAMNVAVLGPELFEKLAAEYTERVAAGGPEAVRFGETLIRLFPYLIPSFIIASAMFESFINYRLCEVLQRKQEVKFPPLPPFGEWRFPSSVLYVFAFAFALPYVTGDSALRVWTMMEYNLKCVSFALFLIQGLSLEWWWLSKYASKFLPLPLRVALVAFFSVNLVACVWIAILGFTDVCLNFRTRKIKRK